MNEEKQGVEVTDSSENGAAIAEDNANSDGKLELNATESGDNTSESNRNESSEETFDENSEQVMAEEARLEALDATPRIGSDRRLY